MRPSEKFSGRRGSLKGFTLAELLVSVAVLSLLVISVQQLVRGAMSLASNGTKHLDADAEARLVINRMAIDFTNVIKRTDVDYYFQKNAGNDQAAFYSLVSGYYPDGVDPSPGVVTPKSPLCVVGYRIRNNKLERLSKALIWNGVTKSTTGVSTLAADTRPMVFLPQTLTGTWTNIAGSGNDPDYQVIGSQVYRFEFTFLLNDGTIADNHADLGLQDISAIIGTIAVLDGKSRAMVTDMAGAAAKLPDPPANKTPLSVWEEQLQTGDLGVPTTAAAQVRFYQRYFYVGAAR
jgi:prepilin-type N-terminal cleavage/methylation domain-containing protein